MRTSGERRPSRSPSWQRSPDHSGSHPRLNISSSPCDNKAQFMIDNEERNIHQSTERSLDGHVNVQEDGWLVGGQVLPVRRESGWSRLGVVYFPTHL